MPNTYRRLPQRGGSVTDTSSPPDAAQLRGARAFTRVCCATLAMQVLHRGPANTNSVGRLEVRIRRGAGQATINTQCCIESDARRWAHWPSAKSVDRATVRAVGISPP